MIRWAKETELDGAPVIDRPWVRTKLAEIARDTEVLKLLNYRVAWLVSRGETPFAEAAMVKVFGSEMLQRGPGARLQRMGLSGPLGPATNRPGFGPRSRVGSWTMRTH